MGGGGYCCHGGGGGGVVSFLSGLCACWDSRVCRGFFYPWNGVVFFNIRPLRPVELVFLHEFHRWNGVVSFLSGLCACWDSCVCRGFMLRPAVAPGGARVFTWVSSLGWCCVLIPGRCACWDWCVVLRLLRGLFFPCSSLQLCFPEFVFPKVLQTFLCRCFWKNWFPPVSLLIFSSQFLAGLSAAIWLLLSDRSACCTRAFAWVSCFAFYGFFEAFLLRRVSPNVSVQMFFRRFFVHKFLCQYIHRRFRSRTFLANVFFFFFFVQKFFANGFFEAIFPVICLQIFSCFFFSRISLQLFAANCCRSFFADV